MKKIEVIGWVVGFNKVGFTKFMKETMAVDLGTAKQITDQLLDGRPYTIEIKNEKIAETTDTLNKLGVIFKEVS